MELKDLLKEYDSEMEAKRKMGQVCFAHGLSQSEDAKRAWESYDAHLARCNELRKQIEEIYRNHEIG